MKEKRYFVILNLILSLSYLGKAILGDSPRHLLLAVVWLLYPIRWFLEWLAERKEDGEE